jgi:hypothetical protein
MTDSVANRIAIIKTSLRLFVCGIVGLLPVIGFLPALYVVFSYFRLRSRFRDEWNPAANYLSWGLGLALFGLGLSILLIPVIILTRDFPGSSDNHTHSVFD